MSYFMQEQEYARHMKKHFLDKRISSASGKSSLFAACTLLLALMSAAAADPAGIKVPVTVKDYIARPIRSLTTDIFVEGAAMAGDVSELSDSDSRMIYRSELKTLYLIDNSRRTVERYDGRVASGISSGLGSARAALDDLLGRIQGSAVKERVTGALQLTRTEVKRNIYGLECRGYVISRKGVKVQEIWLAPWSALGFKRGDFAPVWSLLEIYAAVASDPALAKLLEQIEYVPASELLKLDGYPVLIRHFNSRRIAYDIFLGRPRRAAAPDGIFSLPSGYRLRNGWGL
jgi:hypothetical protein